MPFWTRLTAALLLALTLAACGTINRPPIDSVADAIVVTAADIESLATQTRELCGNTAPGGPCQPTAAISTDDKERIKNQLQDAQDALVDANRALAAAQGAEAEDDLARAEAILATIQAILEERAQ